jgi:hypothetical protein
MTIYQHLLILIPALTLMYWGFYAKESTGTIIAALLGFATMFLYLGTIIVKWLSVLFSWVGTF